MQIQADVDPKHCTKHFIFMYLELYIYYRYLLYLQTVYRSEVLLHFQYVEAPYPVLHSP